ncbi:hypothetical protein J2751_000389 [Halorubrum alkaliphilum]|uniref:Uncharacterized protein n=1 Tax=Halorubrum alkaliphilum TaxID=261290 RepID=A0A8T4GCN1_9EURY|nr:hypothetical protein [Halorubrum alkaliphilum]MBP1921400.1 hypothetical protein [Halorubrum alkaliphilum]
MTSNGDDPADGAEGSAEAPADGPESADAMEAAGVDPVVPEEADGEAFPPNAERRESLREIAADVRGESDESKQLSAILYRVSDLYDPDEETSPEEIYLNVRHIMRIKAQGGLRQ